MAVEKEVKERLHILTLVIRKDKDVPRIRTKAKLFAGICRINRISAIQIATAASEMSRLLLKYTNGGTVSYSIVFSRTLCPRGEKCGGIELLFQGRRAGRNWNVLQADSGRSASEFLYDISPISSLKKILDHVIAEEGQSGIPLKVQAIKWGFDFSWDDLQGQQEIIREQLFEDTEESYLENLRAKHGEVLRLLRELATKNYKLDQTNVELLQLSQDLEVLAHERTVAEIGLRIADQIRNPATAIGGLVRVLIRQVPEDFPGRKKLETIFREAQKLEEIVSNFEKLAQQQSTFFEEADLRLIVEDVLKTWRPLLIKKGVTASEAISDRPVTVWANKQTLKVAVLHILRNALDASPRGSTIQISVHRENGHPIVVVRDQGPGIPEEIREKLLRESVTTKSSGTGVGLILVQHILKEHQGSIEFESHPGKGTTVRLKFPVRWQEG
ncbi:MAG TPA: hypothetical protein EYP57_06140 [Thermodesulfobacteriaceae bacterium]|nr:hypothetical protein [Thermodesulfobacteriaceae bacterium]